MSRELVVSRQHVTETLTRHGDFWNKGSGGFLRYTGVYSQSSPIRLPQRDGEALTNCHQMEPKMVSPDDLIRIVENYDHGDLDAYLADRGEYLVNVGQGDFLPLAMPLMKFPWLEAILGCRVEMTDGQIWDKEFPGDPETIARDRSAFDSNPWFEIGASWLLTLLGYSRPDAPGVTSWLGRLEVICPQPDLRVNLFQSWQLGELDSSPGLELDQHVSVPGDPVRIRAAP